MEKAGFEGEMGELQKTHLWNADWEFGEEHEKGILLDLNILFIKTARGGLIISEWNSPLPSKLSECGLKFEIKYLIEVQFNSPSESSGSTFLRFKI